MLPRLPNMPLKNNGRWIVDADGRVVIIRGVNMINKLPPYTLSAAGFGPEDADLLAANGFNAVRVGVIYSAIEPSPGTWDNDYLWDIRATVDMLASKGIMSLIDFHQDGWGPVFNGEGFPGWATVPPADGNKPNVTFPAVLETPAVMAAFGNFWRNVNGPDGDPLQEHFALAWSRAVQILKDSPGILGWELLNEPWPGDLLNEKDIIATHDDLRAFTKTIVAAIREQDSDHMIWYEPWVTFDDGVPTFIGKIDDPAGRIGFAFHNYIDISDPSKNYNLAWDNAIDHFEATGAALLATEFGGDNNPQVITDQLKTVNLKMLPAIYWAYWNRTPYVIAMNGNIISSEDMGLVYDLDAPPTAPGNLQTDKLAALTQPYPMFVAGTPLNWSFDADPAVRAFTLTYVPFTSGSNVTEIFVPELHYPNGSFYVTYSSGVTVTIDGQTVTVECDGSVSEVTVNILPS